MSRRFDYIAYDQAAQAKSAAFKAKFIELEELADHLLRQESDCYVDDCSVNEAKRYALKALEEAYMWIGKAIRNEQVLFRKAALQEGRSNS